MIDCPRCQSHLFEYRDEGFKVRVCWNCGHYESDSQAYLEHPEMFENIIRENPTYFLKKFLKSRPSDEFTRQDKSDEDYTEPYNTLQNG